MNGTPFGASSHWIDSKFDNGDIFFREKIKFKKFENAKQIYVSQISLLEKIMKKTINSIKKIIFEEKNKIKELKIITLLKTLMTLSLKDILIK